VNTNVSAYDAVELAIEMDYIADRVREMPADGKRAERLPFIIKAFEGHAKKLRHAVDEHEAIAEKIREQHPRGRLRGQADERSSAGSERSNRMDLWARVAAVACDLIEEFNPAGLPDRPKDYPVPGRREILVALKPISAVESDQEFATACREAIDHILKGMYFEALHSLNRALESH
jgi:hypothetical protein